MLYYYFFVAIVVGAAYVWATKKHGRAASITSWRNAINQTWALYRRRLLKRTRSQTPPALFTDSGTDQVPLLTSDRLESVTSDGESLPGDLLLPPPSSAAVRTP